MMDSNRKFAMELLKKQLKDLLKNDDSGFSIGLEDEDDFFRWSACFQGPPDTLLEGGFYKAILTFPEDYPSSPPKMQFITEMWHPNIYPDGNVCISILHPAGIDALNEQETADERWRPIIGVEAILMSVVSMLNDPNVESPANVDAAVQFKEDFITYKKKVRVLAAKSMDVLGC